MKNTKTILTALVAASLILVAGCYDGGPTMPPVVGYSGLVNSGWTAFEAGDYTKAMDYFQQAIEADCSQPDAYLGAAWSALLLPDYWMIADQYSYMAVQLDGGSWPVESKTEAVEQDLPWTEFQCIYPELTANDSIVINSWGTGDTLVVDGTTVFEPDSNGKLYMDNKEIGDWLYQQYGAISFRYEFTINEPVGAIFAVTNGFSLVDCPVDSFVTSGSTTTVYITVPHVKVKVGDDNYRTWCMYENQMTFDYATYQTAGGAGIAKDAVCSYGLLQNIRGENGNALLGVAALVNLADEEEYSFSHYSGVNSLKMKGMAAAIAFANQHFRPALFICQSEGFGAGISVSDPNFVVELMQAIESMLQ